MSTALALTLEDYVVRRVQELEQQLNELNVANAKLLVEVERLNVARRYVADRVRGNDYDSLVIDSEYSSSTVATILEALELPYPYDWDALEKEAKGVKV